MLNRVSIYAFTELNLIRLHLPTVPASEQVVLSACTRHGIKRVPRVTKPLNVNSSGAGGGGGGGGVF